MSTVAEQQEEIQYIKEQVLARFPLLGVTMRTLSVVADDRVGRVGTDGHRIIYSPKFFSTLSDEQKQFAFAHEVMHVAFNHILRSKGRDHRLWNYATDAVINQILKNEKLPITEDGVDIAEAANHSAEEMYEKLLKKKKQRDQEKQQQQQNQNQNQEQQQEQSQSSGDEQSQDQDEKDQSQQEQPQDQNKQNQSEQGQPQDQDKQEEQDQSDQQSSDNQQGSSKTQNGQRSQSGSSSESDTDWDDSNIDWDNEDEQVGHDSHDLWKEAVEQAEREEQQKQEESKKKSLWDRRKEVIERKEVKEDLKNEPQENEAPVPQDENMDAYEKGFWVENQKKRHEMAEQVREQLNRIKESFRQSSDYTTVGDVGETKTPVVDWKKMLKKSLDEERDRWSYRRASAENDYMARVEELEDEGRPDTEVMLDVSGSVDICLLREFLRQLKPLLKSSKLKVGCFAGYASEFKVLKTKADIDYFVISGYVGCGTNLDAPVRAFSKKKDVNKIIFTDGFPGKMPEEDLKGMNVIWLVYGNKDFNPCCGKVIQVSERQLQSYIQTAPLSRGGR